MFNEDGLGGAAQFLPPSRQVPLLQNLGLDNPAAQVIPGRTEGFTPTVLPQKVLIVRSSGLLAEKLARLKKDKFTATGRAERIARSLAALNAPQTIYLSPSEWREIVESDIEDQF